MEDQEPIKIEKGSLMFRASAVIQSLGVMILGLILYEANAIKNDVATMKADVISLTIQVKTTATKIEIAERNGKL